MKLKEIIDKSNKIVILSGAGVSTASGLKDFRSSDGLYSVKMDIDPITLLSRDHYNQDPMSTINYIVDNFIVNKDVKANLGHTFAYDLHKAGKLVGVITQNIDNLYNDIGLPEEKIVEIHGSGSKFICSKCNKDLDITEITVDNLSPCCNAILDTKVILYGDNFNYEDYKRYQQMLSEADTILVMGTSLHISAHMYAVMHVENRILINNELLDYNNEMFNYTFIGDINEILKENGF